MKTNINLLLNTCNDYEIIVIGGGPSGCTAAIAAAREGKKTLLIEKTGALGGMGTMGLVPAWCPFSDKEKPIYKGLALEIFNKSKDKVINVPQKKLDWVAINAEELKIIYDEMVTDSGVDILFHTSCCHVETQGNKIVSIITNNKAGLTIYTADMYIDCTGDGDVAVMAGADYEVGDAKNNVKVQPSTHCFTLGNVDSYAYEHISSKNFNTRDENSIPVKIMRDEELDLIVDTHLCKSLYAPNSVGFNAGHIFDLDGVNPIDLSKAMITGRKIASQFLIGLKRYAPESFSNAYVSQTAPLMGIRETRRIICDYRITKDDYFQRRTFDDEIARNCYFIDIHNSKEEVKDVQNLTFDIERFEPLKPGESHGIPYRSLVPKGITNLLVAGRLIGCDHDVNASVRVMPVCLVTGEAAGVAASLATDDSSVDVHQIDTDVLRTKLKQYGAYFK